MTRVGHTRLLTGLITVCFAMALPAVALAHLERPSYWPDPAPDTSVSPPAGGKVPKLRSLESAVSGRGRRQGPRGLPGPRRLEVARRAGAVDRQRAQARLPAAAEPAQAEAEPLAGDPAVLGEPTCSHAVRVQRDPARGQRLAQQRPRRGHAGRLHRAHLARAAAQRPALRLADAGGLERRQDAQLPLPGHLPQRPEPDPHPGPRGARHAAAEPAAQEPSGHPRPRPLRALQLPARGQRRAADRRDHRRRLRLRVGRPRGAAAHLPQARDRARGPRRRVRGAQLHRARGARARPLRRGDRRLPDRHGEDVLERRLRQPDLHLRPRPLHRLRRDAAPATPSSTRAPPPRPASRPTSRSIRTRRASTRPCATATCAAACSRTRARWATRCASPHNNIYGNTAGISTDTISAAGHPGFPADSVQVDHNWIYSNNLELYKPNPPVDAARRDPAGRRRDLLGRPQQRRGVRQLDLGQLAQRRVPALDPGLPRHARGQRQSRAARATSTTLSTSCGNRFFDNDLGRVPKGFKSFPELYGFGNNVGATRGKAPNGVDFWWDEGGIGSVTGNCWFANIGPRRDRRRA